MFAKSISAVPMRLALARTIQPRSRRRVVPTASLTVGVVMELLMAMSSPKGRPASRPVPAVSDERAPLPKIVEASDIDQADSPVRAVKPDMCRFMLTRMLDGPPAGPVIMKMSWKWAFAEEKAAFPWPLKLDALADTPIIPGPTNAVPDANRLDPHLQASLIAMDAELVTMGILDAQLAFNPSAAENTGAA